MRDVESEDIMRVVVNRSQSLSPFTKKPLIPGETIQIYDVVESQMWGLAAIYRIQGKDINISGKKFLDCDGLRIDDLELIGRCGEYAVLQTNPADFAKDLGRIEDNGIRRPVRAGDVIRIEDIFVHKFDHATEHLARFNGHSHVCMSCLKRHESGVTDQCVCDTRDLMLGGCTCGFMQRAKIGAGK